MTFKSRKYKAVFNPLGWAPKGQYTIKTDDLAETPLAVVFVPHGPKDAKERAREKAQHIVDCLNNYKPN